MDEDLRGFVNPDQPFGPITAPAISNTEAFASLFDTSNGIAKEMNKRPALIIGRRGAGKTAFLNSLSLGARYDVIVSLEPGEAFPSMIRTIEQRLPRNILAEETALLWSNLLFGAVSKELLHRFPLEATGELAPVAHYLHGLGVKDGMSVYAAMRAILKAVADLNKKIKVLIDAIEDLASRGVTYRVAKSCAEDFMRRRGLRGIIMMDSLEQFPLDEIEMEKALVGLLRCIGGFNQPDRPFEIRCCLPSELYPRLITLASNPLKDLSSFTVLHWRAHELLHLASLRYLHFIRLYDPKTYERTFSDLDINKRRDLRTFWNHVMPPLIRNRLGGQEDSIAYLMRHTQLLPRHLLLYLNEISKKALRENGKSFKFSEDTMIAGIRASEHMLCREIYSGFRQVVPNAEDACRGMLPNLPLRFGIGDLHKVFNRNRRWLERFEDHHEILRVLLKIGAVGVVSGENERYTEAVFEYTLPDDLNYRADDSFCVHPIFVEEYRVVDVYRSQRVLPVYPSGSEVAFD